MNTTLNISLQDFGCMKLNILVMQAFSPINQILKFIFQTVNSILKPTVDTSTLVH